MHEEGLPCGREEDNLRVTCFFFVPRNRLRKSREIETLFPSYSLSQRILRLEPHFAVLLHHESVLRVLPGSVSRPEVEKDFEKE
jgi:hypothetical protein